MDKGPPSTKNVPSVAPHFGPASLDFHLNRPVISLIQLHIVPSAPSRNCAPRWPPIWLVSEPPLKSTTLDDLEGPLRYALSIKRRASFGAHHENLNKDRLYCQRRRCSAYDSRFWQYKDCAVIPRGLRGGVKRQWGNRKRRFRTLRFRHLRK